jgi:hypothetical protein
MKTQATKTKADSPVTVKLSDFCFALHNFPANLKADYLARANKLGFKNQVAVPTRINKIADSEHVIVISFDGEVELPASKSTNLSFIVNSVWLKETSDAIENSTEVYEVSQLNDCLS